MRISRFVSILACAAPVVFASSSLVAQVVGGGVGSVVLGMPIDAGGNSKGQPYTATFSQKQVQVLANGTTITHESTTRMARDSSGRTYNEVHNPLPAGQDGQPHETVFYHVFDPVAHTTMMWNSSSKEAHVVHMPEPQTIAARPAPPVPGMSATVEPNVALPPRAVRTQQDVQREDLGTKNIAGVNAKGTRITRVIPAGREGNDQPITITEEMWRSTEYGLSVMSVREDPRYGTTTREATEFQAGEPDAGLFRVPEGYTVRDDTAHMGGLHQ
jgi:hypothetical protein